MAQTAETQVAALLGGPKVLGGISGAAEFVDAVRHGLPYAALEALSAVLQTDLSSVGDVVGIAPRTLARRKHEKLLSPIESDRLYRIVYISPLSGVDPWRYGQGTHVATASQSSARRRRATRIHEALRCSRISGCWAVR